MSEYARFYVMVLIAFSSVLGGLAAEEQGRITWEEGYSYSYNSNQTLSSQTFCRYEITYTLHPRWYGLIITTDGTTTYRSGNTYNNSGWYLVEEGSCFTFNNTKYYLHKVIDGSAVVEEIDMTEWGDY